MDLVKYNIINFLLQLNIKIGRKLSYLLAKYEADEYVEKNENIDLRSIPRRIKNIILHDQDIIDQRRTLCNDCEHRLGLNCKKCGCFIAAKTRVAITSCPVGKWGKVEIEGKKVGTYVTS
ncbi:hypothetical protein CMI37_21180 [Candidatus Pacearchaeota archaeon]|nr:hypothetical protein [Candidatus Pacearchaeota archaeon]